MFTNFSLKAKLILAFLSVAFLPVVVGAVSYFYSTKVIQRYRSLGTDNLPNIISFVEMKAQATGSQIPVASLVGIPSTPEETAKAKKEFDAYIEKFNLAAKEYEASPFAEGEEALWKDYKNGGFKDYLEMSQELIRLSGTNNKADQKVRDQKYDHEYQELIKKRVAQMTALVGFQTKDAEANSKLGDTLNSQMNMIILLIVALGFCLAIGFGYFISTYLSRELKAVAVVLAEGTEQVSSAVTELSSTAEELSSSSTQQAASVQETASSVEEISAMVRKNATNATECEKFSAGSKGKAENGKEAVNLMIASMSEISSRNSTIQEEIQGSNKKLGDVIHVIQEIGSKTKVINDIVFQTKLLSFNASVEAARAGEHGKGFAVVAEEVGNLAQMSGNAAKEISSLLEESMKKVENMISETTKSLGTLMAQSKETVDNGNRTAETCGKTLEEIVEGVNRVSSLVEEISGAGREQSQGIDEISKAVQQIDQATQSNASAAQQTASSSHSLSQEVYRLQNAASRLNAIIEGGIAVVAKEEAPDSGRKSQVLEFKKKPKSAPSQGQRMVTKKAAGSELSVPAGNDPRFEEV